MKLLILVIVFFLIAGFFIISENKIYLKEEQGRKAFGEEYYFWMNKTFENTKSIVGYVFKMDWLPD